MTVGMIGRKVGMMRVYDGAGRVRGVTVVEIDPNRVTQLRTSDRDGYEAVQIGHRGNRKRVSRPERGHLREAGVDEPLTRLREVPSDGSDFTLGQEITVDQFTPGEYVDVTATSKGRGFAGGVRRWGFAGGPKTHGQSDKWRGPGSVGAGTYPGKTWKGQKMAGHMGARRKTVLNLLVVQTDASRNLLLVEGSVPGPRGGLVNISPARRAPLEGYEPPEPFAPAEGSATSAESAPEAADVAEDVAEDEAETAVDGDATNGDATAEATTEEPAAETAEAAEAADEPEAAEPETAESDESAAEEDEQPE
jgi:large subunit ribosomal protein L3